MNINPIYKKIIFNTFTQFGTKAISLLLSLLSVSLLTRYLGTEGYGNYTLVFTYISFFAILSDFGLNIIVVREFSQEEKKSDIAKATFLNLKFILIGLSIILPVLGLLFFPYSRYIKIAIVISSFAVALGNLSSYGTSILQSKISLVLVALVDLITKLITVLIIAIFTTLNFDFYYIIGSVFIGNLFGSLISLYLVRDQLVFKVIIDKKLLFNILRMGFPVGITSFLSLAYFKIDTLIISVLKSPADVGIYGLSYKVLENVLLFWGLYMASIFPLLSKYYGSLNFIKFRDLITKTLMLIVLISISTLVIGYMCAPFIMRILGGSHFYSSIYPFRILLLGVPLFIINNLLYNIILSFGKTSYIILPLLLSLVTNITLNLLFVPKFSYIGASYVTCLSELVTLLTYALVFHYKFRNEANYWNLLK